MSDFYDKDGNLLYGKELHKARVSDTPNRIKYAIQQFERYNIAYELKNAQTGHFHAFRKADNKLFEFYAGTGKIKGENSHRGIMALVRLLLKQADRR